MTLKPNQFVKEGVMYTIDPNSNVFKVFHQLFQVIMPVMQVRSIDDIRERGVVITGDKRYDQAIREERRHYYQTIAQLVEHHRKGVQIRLVNQKDAVEIYRLIQNHLLEWAEKLQYAFNVRVDQEQIDDLMAMDDFAQAVYPRAQENSEKTAHFDDFARSFLGIDKKKGGLGLTMPSRRQASVQPAPAVKPAEVTPDNPFAHLVGRQASPPPVPSTLPPNIPQRQSLSSVFRRRKIQHDPIFHQHQGDE